jgi:hypothetical protein
MKNKSSFLFLFTSLFVLGGVFLVQPQIVEAKDCVVVQRNIQQDCVKKNTPEGTLATVEIINACEPISKKAYNQCVGSTRATAECDQKKIEDEKKCAEDAIARHLEPVQAKAACIYTVDNNYRKCTGSINGQFEIPSNLDELNQFQGLTLNEVIGNFMGMTMKILGSIAFALMVGAGLMWMTAGGNSDRQRKALDTMVWAGLGVVMILSSATIVKFVFDAFTN